MKRIILSLVLAASITVGLSSCTPSNNKVETETAARALTMYGIKAVGSDITCKELKKGTGEGFSYLHECSLKSGKGKPFKVESLYPSTFSSNGNPTSDAYVRVNGAVRRVHCTWFRNEVSGIVSYKMNTCAQKRS